VQNIGFIIRTVKCTTYVVILIITVTLSSCERDKTILTHSEYYKNNSIIITLNKSEYVYKETAEVTIINLSDNDLILLNCGFIPGFYFEKKINGQWKLLYDKVCAHIHLPFFIEQGTVFKFSTDIDPFENFTTHSSGTYRLKLWLYKIVGDKRKSLDDSQLVTPEFFLISN